MSKTTNNTIIATATALAIGTGVYFFTDNSTTANANVWTMPTIELPTLDLPELSIAELSVPDLSVNELAIPELNTVELQTTELNTVELQTTELNTINLPDIILDDMQINSVQFNVAELSLNIPDFIQIGERMEALRKMAIDQRNIEYSKHPYINDWYKIYKDYANVEPIKYIPIKSGFRIISEVRLPKSADELNNLSKNLQFYKNKGYNAALVNFVNGDNVNDIVNLIRYVKSHGLYVFFAFGGPENLGDEIYCNVEWFTEMLTRCARESHGFMPWRRSSLHLFIPDKAWNNFVHHTIRKANPEIYVLGEIYYGMTALEHPKIKWWYNIPTNCSGVLLKNIGFNGINLEATIANIRKKNINVPLISLVVGERPYYASKFNTNRTFNENLNIKFQLEKRFIKGGSAGTITLNCDGSDGIYNKNIVNNLSKYIIK